MRRRHDLRFWPLADNPVQCYRALGNDSPIIIVGRWCGFRKPFSADRVRLYPHCAIAARAQADLATDASRAGTDGRFSNSVGM